jgi:hypothetical protein
LGTVREVHEGFPQRVEYPREEDTPHRDLPIHESENAEARLVEFRAADRALFEIDKADPLPVVVMGVERDLSAFREASHHPLTIAGEVAGNHVTTTLADLAALAAPVIAQWTSTREREIVAEAVEAIGAHKCVIRLDAVQDAVPEGRVRRLLVERDLRVPASDTQDLTTPRGDGVTGPDLIDGLVREVLRHGGDVSVISPDLLAAQGRIAALLRY